MCWFLIQLWVLVLERQRGYFCLLYMRLLYPLDAGTSNVTYSSSDNTTYIVFISARYKFDGFNCSERLKSVTPIFRNNRSDLLRCTFEIWCRSQSSGDPPSGTHYINRIISASAAPRATAFPHKTPLFPSNYSTLFFLPAFYLCIINPHKPNPANQRGSEAQLESYIFNTSVSCQSSIVCFKLNSLVRTPIALNYFLIRYASNVDLQTPRGIYVSNITIEMGNLWTQNNVADRKYKLQ